VAHGLVSSWGDADDYRSEDFVARVADLTGGAGVDATFDLVGPRPALDGEDDAPVEALVAYGYYAGCARRNAVMDVVAQY
jgi:NADPH:quinone reductase-like Zn-dependent oxidoreductase